MTNSETQKRHLCKVAVFVLLCKEEKIFILRRANTGWADGMWTVPSGHVEQGQTPTDAAIMETREEAGVIVKKEDLQFVHVHAVEDAYINFYFVALKWEGDPYLAEPEKCSEVAWVALDALPEDTILQVRALAQSMREGSYFSEVVNDPKAEIISHT